MNPLDEIDDIYADSAPTVESAKLVMGFLEKLVVLAAASLAASVTAIGIVHQHPVGDGGIGYLKAAWKLLFCSITCSLLGQTAAANFVSTSVKLASSLRIISLLGRAKLQGLDISLYREQHSAIVRELPNMQTTASRRQRLANVFAPAGVIFLIVAFYWLYRFAEVSFRV